jgi:hypothetical protein
MDYYKLDDKNNAILCTEAVNELNPPIEDDMPFLEQIN